jgi:Ala-tRNA(Pro) deacylase
MPDTSANTAADTAADLPTPPGRLLQIIAELGIAAETITHEAVFTVEQSRHVSHGIPGAHTKNLFVKDKKGQLFLVVAEHDRRIDLKRLHEVIGASGRLSFGSAEQMMAHLGVTPGSVTAFAVVNDTSGQVSVVLDKGLAGLPRVNCHPMVNTMTTGLSCADLMRFWAHTGHTPLIIDLPAPPDE